MKLNLSKFKKVKSDKHVTILQHDDGHQFHVAHASLSPKMRKDLDMLPVAEQMAKGGEVKPKNKKKELEIEPVDQEPLDYEAIPETPKNPLDYEPVKMADAGMVQDAQQEQQQQKPDPFMQAFEAGRQSALSGDSSAVQSQSQPPVVNAPVAVPEPIPQTTEAPVVQPQVNQPVQQPISQAPVQQQSLPDQMGFGVQERALEKSRKEETGGLRVQAEAAKSMGAAVQKAEDVRQSALMDLNRVHQDNIERIIGERQRLRQDIEDSHIDPTKYMSSMNFGGKLATVLGLVASGIGSGISGKENLALRVINDNINRDIDAQKAELGKKKTLYEANLEDFRNEKDAHAMTRLQIMDEASSQIAKAAAKTNSEMERGRLLMMQGQMDRQRGQEEQQLILRRTMLQGTQDGLIPMEKMVAWSPLPQHMKDAAMKEIPEANKAINTKDRMLEAFDRLASYDTMAKRIKDPVGWLAARNAIEPLNAEMSLVTSNRYTESDAKATSKLWTGIVENPQTSALKRKEVVALLNRGMSYPNLSAMNIDVNKMGKYGKLGQENDPIPRRKLK